MRGLMRSDVAIVGLGLMGGSLAGALRGYCNAVVGVARRAETIEAALSRDLIDEGTTDLEGGIQGAHVVVLAVPVRTILSLLTEIGPFLSQGCLLMDVGSTKAEIMAGMVDLPTRVQPLGGHPMCGKEVSGIAAAEPTLYEGQTFVLTPLPRTSDAALALGRALVEATGAQPLVLEPERHDRLVATISHLPYLLACALVGVAEDVSATDPTVWEVAASGFRDTSRLAASDVTMMVDILLTNRGAVLEALDHSQAHLSRLAGMIASGDEDHLRDLLTARRDRRAGMWT